MNLCALIIPTCRHILSSGRRCLQPAVRGRTCCRHHLDARARLHNMARARRRSTILRLRVTETLRDLAWNTIELNRVLATERLAPETARMMLWAMDLSAFALPTEPAPRARNRTSKPNGIYDVPVTHFPAGSLADSASQVTENTNRVGGEGLPRRAVSSETAAWDEIDSLIEGLLSCISEDDELPANGKRANPGQRYL